MKFFQIVTLLLGSSLISFAGLTSEQKIADMTQLAGIFNKNYAPYEWKRDALGFDLMNLQPWLDRAVKTKTDLDFLELLIEYVASLNDAHDAISFPSDFYASLGFSVNIYDGKPLIDSVSRSVLPSSKYPFVVGDELISIDGKPVADYLKEFSKYQTSANPRSTVRSTAQLLTIRLQALMPHAHEIGESAAVVIRRASGVEENYSIPWNKSGTPIIDLGGQPVPKANSAQRSAGVSSLYVDDSLPSYMAPMIPLLNTRLPTRFRSVLNYGGRPPIFSMPSNFVQRLGRNFSDYFYSGTYDYDGVKVGFIRIPDFDPASASGAIQQFDTEIRYMQQNTDGLVIDLMRNPGGSPSYVEALMQRVIPGSFQTLGYEIRATPLWIEAFSGTLESAKASNAPDWVIANLNWHLGTIKQANGEARGRTGSVPLNSLGLMVLPSAPSAYLKPIMLITDEMSASAAEAFPAIFQDNKRGLIFGMRTMGAGGTLFSIDFTATNYTQGFVTLTLALMNRQYSVVTDDYPKAAYVENIGVRPDIIEDYMTRQNLLNSGRPFVDTFSKAIVAHIRKSKQ